jgi:hypothetical protein
MRNGAGTRHGKSGNRACCGAAVSATMATCGSHFHVSRSTPDEPVHPCRIAGDQEQRLASTLVVVVEVDAVRLDLSHDSPPDSG